MTIKRYALALLAFAGVAASCTPEQLLTMGITPDNAPNYEELIALDDHRIPLHNGWVIELDGSITKPAPRVAAAPAPTSAPAPTGGYAHPNGNVQRWYGEFLDVGFRADEWRKVSCIINRESGGNPSAYNGRDPNGGSRGLMQINGANNTFLRDRGVINVKEDLFNGWINLKAGLVLQRAVGSWSPWSSTQSGC